MYSRFSHQVRLTWVNIQYRLIDDRVSTHFNSVIFMHQKSPQKSREKALFSINADIPRSFVFNWKLWREMTQPEPHRNIITLDSLSQSSFLVSDVGVFLDHNIDHNTYTVVIDFKKESA